MTEETRLFIGGPLDKKYKSFELNPHENGRTAYFFLISKDREEIKQVNIFDFETSAFQHIYYPSDFFFNGVPLQIVMRYNIIEEEDLWAHVLKGYAKNCLQHK